MGAADSVSCQAPAPLKQSQIREALVFPLFDEKRIEIGLGGVHEFIPHLLELGSNQAIMPIPKLKTTLLRQDDLETAGTRARPGDEDGTIYCIGSDVLQKKRSCVLRAFRDGHTATAHLDKTLEQFDELLLVSLDPAKGVIT